jgi:hypothetical protein
MLMRTLLPALNVIRISLSLNVVFEGKGESICALFIYVFILLLNWVISGFIL